MTARRLKAVPTDEAPVKRAAKAPVTVKAAAGKSYRELLIALRDNIAEQIDGGVQARDLAALSRRLLEISKELEGLEAGEKGDDVGDAAATEDEPWVP